MFVKTAPEFCKREVCPSAETLLGFADSDLYSAETISISAHLDECEFCTTELYFLLNFPQTESNCGEAPKIPFAIKQLAETLLGGRENEFQTLENLLYSSEQLTLKDA